MTIDAEDEDVPVTNSGSGSQEFNFEAVTEVSSMIPRNSNANTTRTQQQRRMRILTSQDSKSNQDTFEESFSKHRHAGSFRLRYSRDEFASEANVDNVVAPSQSLKSADDSKDTDIRIHELCFYDSDSNSEVLVKPEDELPQEVDQEQSTVKISKDSNNKTKQLRVLNFQGSDNCNPDTFEEAFSKHRYAGSFRLRFGRDEVASLANRASDNSADTTESLTLDLQDEIDIEELAIDLPQPAILPGKKTTINFNNPESKVLEVEGEKGPVDLITTDSELYVNDNITVQENVNVR